MHGLCILEQIASACFFLDLVGYSKQKKYIFEVIFII